MIITISNSTDVTADFLCDRLRAESVPFVRLDTDNLARTVSMSGRDGAITLATPSGTLTPTDVTCIWLRRPREIVIEEGDAAERAHTALEWSEAIEAFLHLVPKSKWINHPSFNKAASLKMLQLIHAKSVGLLVPDTIVTQSPVEATEFYERHGGRIITKPLSGGYIERELPGNDTQIFTSRVEPRHLEELLLIENCPTLLQAEVAKATDVRVTVIDESMTAVSLSKIDDATGRQIVDIRRENMQRVEYRRIELPSPVRSSIAALMRHYGLRFAAIDFAVTGEGRWIFFEVNPGGQWAWLDIAGVSDIAGDMVRSIRS